MARPARSLSGPGILRLTLALLLAGLLAVSPRPAVAEDEPVLETTFTIAGAPEPGQGSVALDLSLFVTDPAAARPAIVLAHGFGGTKADSAGLAQELARTGYAVITYTARGFGASGGRIHLNDPAYEGLDARAVIDFAAGRPEVRKDGTDPVLGFAGGSYGGAVALLAAGLDPRVDAVVPAFTWHRLTSALFPQYAISGPVESLGGADPAAPAGVFKQRWAALFFRSGAPPDRNGRADQGGALCGRFTAELCRGYLAAAQSGRASAALVTLLDAAGAVSVLDQVRVPTLIIHGEQDTLFPLDQADANLRGLPAGTPAKMAWVAGGHDAEIDLDAVRPELEAWFGRYLGNDQSPVDTRFTAVVPQPQLVGREDDDDEPRELVAASYPGRESGLAVTTVALRGDAQTVVSPPGGAPAALTSLPGTGGLLSSGVVTAAGYRLAVLPGQSATFTSDPLADPYPLLGSGSVTLEVSSSRASATLFAGLWDLGPDVTAATPPPGQPRSAPGTAVLPLAAVAPVRLSGLTPGRATRVRVALPPVAHEAPVGHRWQLVVSSTDQAYAVPTAPATYRVALAGDRALTLPRVDGDTVGAGRLDVPGSLLAGVAAVLVAASGLALLAWRRRHGVHPRPDLAHLPLVVEGLVKSYPARRRGAVVQAVDGISFAAERGQVVGLLGPNGAGKTTAMRMMVGLIRPDEGTVYLGGEPVVGGAEALASVGAFIEGPGFLPHLTGRENLLAYWGATGRPLAEAFLDEVLAVAALGSAIDRRVRGYSQGMRQRLGIAQAMLGRPALLLLDEPTNGLDPPQIRTMRTVLRDYAASGRTVVVSSHLLAEVQQTCSHVVVMQQGRVVLIGSMAALTASDDGAVIGLVPGSDLAGAAAVLRQLGAEASIADGALRVSGGGPRERLVAHLVGAGFGVTAVDGRRQLEEVFMSLVGPGGDRDG